ncbi:hypothetical protein NQD34_005069 [Periophthalmus magnuspinnatus]|nr:hypothetical protein NQD34_005069 [Periophthalmus magnuspinnatus]
MCQHHHTTTTITTTSPSKGVTTSSTTISPNKGLSSTTIFPSEGFISSFTYPRALLTTRRLINRRTVKLSNQRHLVYIPCKTITSSPTETNLKLAVLNVRSLCNKSFLINDFIYSFSLDFMFITKAWLDKNTGNAILVESTPPNFKFESETQVNKKGGGVCAFFRDNLVTHRLSFGVFSSFEYVSFKMELKQSPSILYLVICKPPQHCLFY